MAVINDIPAKDGPGQWGSTVLKIDIANETSSKGKLQKSSIISLLLNKFTFLFIVQNIDLIYAGNKKIPV